ncbi:MAG: metal ABC transporter ATP-binding protein, partial [Actinomycetota bacterium]
MSDLPPALELRDARVRLRGTEVLRGVNFSLGRGEFVILLGANGSGKTTLVRAALGLVPLTGGEAQVFGRHLGSFRDWAAIGYVPQRMTAASRVPATVGEVVLSGRAARVGLLRPFRQVDRDAAQRALELVDLAGLAGSPVDRLSGGQQQRVLIARALAGEPTVLVMDEPVASVDLAHQETLAANLSSLHSRGTSILLVAHSLGAMEPLAERAVVLEGGTVVYDGLPRAITSALP